MIFSIIRLGILGVGKAESESAFAFSFSILPSAVSLTKFYDGAGLFYFPTHLMASFLKSDTPIKSDAAI